MTRVSVPVRFDVRISVGGEEPKVYPVCGDGFTDVPEEEVQLFLQAVTGSAITENAPAKPAGKEK